MGNLAKDGGQHTGCGCVVFLDRRKQREMGDVGSSSRNLRPRLRAQAWSHVRPHQKKSGPNVLDRQEDILSLMSQGLRLKGEAILNSVQRGMSQRKRYRHSLRTHPQLTLVPSLSARTTGGGRAPRCAWNRSFSAEPTSPLASYVVAATTVAPW